MKLVPYLNFEGSCEEAIDYYASIFNGKIVYKDYYSTSPMDVPESHKDKVMHCQLDFGDNVLMACDAFPGQTVSNGDGIVLSVGFDLETEAAAIFSKLAQDGTVTMPFEQQFWGAWLGQVTDKYGKSWMISTNIYA